MIVEINENVFHVVVLDISGIYARIHNDGYFEKKIAEEVQQQYSDERYWKVIILNWYTYESRADFCLLFYHIQITMNDGDIKLYYFL